jgi:hypothetical protein
MIHLLGVSLLVSLNAEIYLKCLFGMRLNRTGVVAPGMVEALQEYQLRHIHIFTVFKVEMMEKGI